MYDKITKKYNKEADINRFNKCRIQFFDTSIIFRFMALFPVKSKNK